MEDTWTMEDAKNDFTAIAEAVYAGKPQYVTNHSHPDLVIITKKWFEQIKHEEQKENKISTQQTEQKVCSSLKSGPESEADKNKSFVEALLSIPKGDWDLEPVKDTLTSRDVDI